MSWTCTFNSFHKIEPCKILFAQPLLLLIASLLLSPAYANPLASSTEETLRVSELSFSEKLTNPCSLADSQSVPSATEKRNGGVTWSTVLGDLRAKTQALRNNAETILNTNVIQDCSSLELPSVALIPSAEDLTNLEPVEVLRLFYTSLLNHTAHVFFISDQLQRHDTDVTCSVSALKSSVSCLSAHMRELMCFLQLGARTFREDSFGDQDFEDSTSQILNEQLINQPQCSRRTVRDCQTIRSTVTLFRAMTTYLHQTMSATEETSS